MSWEDRRSYRDPIRPSGRYWAVLNGSVPLVPIAGVRIKLHSTFILVSTLILAVGPAGGYPWQAKLECVLALFVASLWHETAHLHGRRWAGEAGSDQIVLTPVGGVPSIASRWRMPSVSALLAGPLASLLLCGICLMALALLTGDHASWNPRHNISQKFPGWGNAAFHFGWLYCVSLLLLAVNLFPIFPLDVGQMLHVRVARRSGFETSARMMCVSSIAGSILIGIGGIVTHTWLVLFLAVTCFYFSLGLFFRWSREVSGGIELAEGLDDPYFGGLLVADPSSTRRRRRLSRWAVRRLRKLARQEELDQLHVDRILAKVSKMGIKSLTWQERRTLKQATSRQRLGDDEGK
jgi:hypothetical protein